MKRSKWLFILLLLLIPALPAAFSKTIRSSLYTSFAPAWNLYASVKNHFFSIDSRISELEEELKKTRLENILLRESHFETDEITANARVIFREPSTWEEGLWINKGALDSPLIVKNSPVLSGDIVVGLIDHLGAHQSRVRLITDPNLNPYVRAERTYKNKSYLLAKGELNGSLDPKSNRLRGTGFNYDFPDQEGPPQDLRSEFPLIQAGDILVTTGLDGVFPKGLKVARVSKVVPLKEGDYYYDIEAESLLSDLNGLKTVSIIQPLGYELKE
jgi:cell shape-determining protein MreC